MKLMRDSETGLFSIRDLTCEDCAALCNMIQGASLPDRRVFYNLKCQLAEVIATDNSVIA